MAQKIRVYVRFDIEADDRYIACGKTMQAIKSATEKTPEYAGILATAKIVERTEKLKVA